MHPLIQICSLSQVVYYVNFSAIHLKKKEKKLVAGYTVHHSSLSHSRQIRAKLHWVQQCKIAVSPLKSKAQTEKPFCLFVSECGQYLSSSDGHNLCLSCLGGTRTEKAFVDCSCPHCQSMSMVTLWSRLFLFFWLKKESPQPCTAKQYTKPRRLALRVT